MKTSNLMIEASMALALLSLGCGLTQTGEDGAIARTADREIPGTHSPYDLDPITAERWIDDVRVGRDLDVNNSVPEGALSNAFSADDPIHVSMEVTNAPAGTMVRMSVVDGRTRQRVWSQEAPVSPGRSHLSFSLSAEELGAGYFRAEVLVGDETVVARSFVVDESNT